MPELPEVEVTRLSFADRIQGAKVLSVKMGKPLRWQLGCDPARLAGARVLAVRRRGKYLLLDLALVPIEPIEPMAPFASLGQGAAAPGLLLIHLGMSGSLSFTLQPRELGPHDHFEMITSLGALTLNDPRRFGAVVFADSQESDIAQKLLAKLGMEPLSDDAQGGFDPEKFVTGLKLRKAPIKQVLLGGELVVGVGNIYASEALFKAGIRPTTPASRISRPRALRLHEAVKVVLARAVQQGGSTLRDFSSADGQAGHFQLEAMVYGRGDEPCRVCQTPIKAIRQGQRSSFFCPNCQKI